MKKETEISRRIKGEILSLYRVKPLEDITIKEVCLSLGIPRTTFYYHFDSVRDALEQLEDDFINGVTAVYDGAKIVDYLYNDEAKFEKMISETKDYLFDHYDFLEAILVIRPNYEFQAKWLERIRPHYSKATPEHELNVEILTKSLLTLFGYSISHKIPKEKVHPEKLMRFMLPILESSNQFLD